MYQVSWEARTKLPGSPEGGKSAFYGIWAKCRNGFVVQVCIKLEKKDSSESVRQSRYQEEEEEKEAEEGRCWAC
jgi:hypothetical protein